MYNTRSGRKGICVFILGTLLCVFLLTLRQHHKGNRFPKAAFRPVLEDPVELVLTESDVAQGESEAAHNATLGVGRCRHTLRSKIMTSTTVSKDLGSICEVLMAYSGARQDIYVRWVADRYH